MGWQGKPSQPNWEHICRKMMVATRRFVDTPNTGNQETLAATLKECEKLTTPVTEEEINKKGPWPRYAV